MITVKATPTVYGDGHVRYYLKDVRMRIGVSMRLARVRPRILPPSSCMWPLMRIHTTLPYTIHDYR